MNTRRRARTAVAQQVQPTPWWIWALAGAALLLAWPALAQQPVPEVVKPPAGNSATIPPTPGISGGQPSSENPLVDGGRAKPVPDTGVIPPPATGTMPVIKPPATTTMPVIPPPGTAGGDRTVVPK